MFKMAAHRVRPVMPPEDKPANKPMTSLELGLLQMWINEGAVDDSDEGEPKNAVPRSIVLGDLPPGVQPINAVDMTSDGSRVAAGRANLVQVYDVDSGLEIISLGGHKDLIQSVRYSPDGTFLAAGSYQIVTVWTAPEGNLLKNLSGHGGPILCAWRSCPDGVTAFSGGQDKTIRVWNLAEGKLLRTLIGAVPVTAVAIVPGGESLLSGGSDGTVRWLDAADGRERISRKGHTAAVLDLAVLPDKSWKNSDHLGVRRRHSARGVDAQSSRRCYDWRKDGWGGRNSAAGSIWSQGSGPVVSHYFRRCDDCHGRRRRDSTAMECAGRQTTRSASRHRSLRIDPRRGHQPGWEDDPDGISRPDGPAVFAIGRQTASDVRTP